jgi:hypothetical protein
MLRGLNDPKSYTHHTSGQCKINLPVQFRKITNTF